MIKPLLIAITIVAATGGCALVPEYEATEMEKEEENEAQ